MAEVTIADLQAYISSLGDLAPATIGLASASLRALWAFGMKTCVLAADPTSTLQAPPIKNVLAAYSDEAGLEITVPVSRSPRLGQRLAKEPCQGDRASGLGFPRQHWHGGENGTSGRQIIGTVFLLELSPRARRRSLVDVRATHRQCGPSLPLREMCGFGLIRFTGHLFCQNLGER